MSDSDTSATAAPEPELTENQARALVMHAQLDFLDTLAGQTVDEAKALTPGSAPARAATLLAAAIVAEREVLVRELYRLERPRILRPDRRVRVVR